MYMNTINGIVSKSPSLNGNSLNSMANNMANNINNSLNNINNGMGNAIRSVKIPNTMKQASAVSQTSSSWFTPTKLITIALMLVILALLGMNIFGYMADGVDILGTILEKLGLSSVDAIKKSVDLSSEGTKLGADIAAGTIKSAADLVESDNSKKGKKQTISEAVNKSDNDDKSSQNVIKNDKSAESNIQNRSATSQKGWCYVGTDRGNRSCISVTESDKCMSGDIFPSRDLCINPQLR